MKRVALMLVLSALLVIGLAPAAGAGQPLVMEKFEESEGPFLDAFLTAVCGFPVLTEFHNRGKFTLFDDLSAKTHGNLHFVFTNPATGASVTERDAFNLFSEPVVEIFDEVEGTLTLIFSDTFKGLPLKWMQPGEGVLIRDAGQVTFNVTVVIDTATGDELVDVMISNVKGPHPFLFLSDPEIAAIFCGALDDGP